MQTSAPVRRLLAVALVAQPLLVGVNATFHPQIEFTAAGILAGAADDPARWYVVHLIAALGAALTVPAVLALRSLVHERGRRVANIGVGAGVLAAVVLTMAFPIEGSVYRLAVTSGLDLADQRALSEAFLGSPEFLAVPVGVLAFTLAGVLLATALLAGRVVPNWQATLYLVGMLATLAGAPGTLVGPIAFLIVTVAAAILARHVTRAEVNTDANTPETVPASPVPSRT